MEEKIEKAIEYYNFKSKKMLDFINSSNNLTVDQIIESGEELAILEYKITALEVAKEN
ncbi:hypothetical protein [Polaribacter sp.]|jgi:hypothetical protein|uniref:hypothetical protein n=1 Tax=Polaribacter sp. TaxID=1920175 RepID=UPI0040487688